ITGLPRDEMEVGFGFAIPRTTLSSRLPAGALGPGLPPVSLSGTTGGNNGTFILPAFGLVWTPDKDASVTYGLGVFEIGGFGVNYPSTLRNPILNPPVPFGRGVGPVYTQLQIFQFAPTIGLKLTDELSVGASATIDSSYLAVDPALFAFPTL